MIRILTVFCLLLFPALSCLAGGLNEQERIQKQTVLYLAGSNYIDRVFYEGNKILRWNKSEFPIKIYIENKLDVPNYYAYSFIKAVAVWQGETEEVIKLQFTPYEDEANIKFKVIKDVEGKEREMGPNTLAFTSFSTRGNELISSTVYMYERGQDGKFYKPYEILNIAIHEFGHALGMTGHSDDETSIMYKAYSPKNQKTSAFINRQDKNTLKLLYQIEPDITNGDKFKETGNIPSKIIFEE